MDQARINKICCGIVARGWSIDLGLEEGRSDQKLGERNQQKTCSGASQGERQYPNPGEPGQRPSENSPLGLD